MSITQSSPSAGSDRTLAPGSARIGLLWLLLLTLVGGGLFVKGVGAEERLSVTQPEDVEEYKLKAAFIAQFVNYVKWPGDRFRTPRQPLIVGVMGTDPFGPELPKYLGLLKGYKGHPIEIRYFKDLTGVVNCHLLFVAAKKRCNVDLLLELLSRKGVLVIGEEKGFAARGGAINFYWKDGQHIGFEVNVEATKRQGLAVRSQLLKLARIAKDKRKSL